MYLAYFDEAGDDGYPEYSSELFVLTSLYMDVQVWKSNFELVRVIREKLRSQYRLPIKTELHMKAFLTDKNPYRTLDLDDYSKKELLAYYFRGISDLDISIINVVINKKNIESNAYLVLDNALTYNVQRIENDLRGRGPDEKFLIITDQGRVGKMTKVTRRIQRYNFIPSRFSPGTAYRREIERLIEDPLPKDSRESYFLQIADAISYIVYLYALYTFNHSPWAHRVAKMLNICDIVRLLETIRPRLNCAASRANEFGIVHYPRQRQERP